MYFNRKNAEQKNWRMIKKGKHFLFGCSLVFAVGAALVAPTVKADTADTGEVETKTANSAAEASSSDEVGTYKAPAVEVSTTSPVVAENPTSSEATSAKTANKEALTQLVEEVKGLDKAGKTEDSLSRLNTALEQAQNVLANAEASQDQVDVAVASLKDAVAQLAAKEEKAATVATEAKAEATEAKAEATEAKAEATEAKAEATEAETSATQPKSRSRRAAGQERAQDRSAEGKDIKYVYKDFTATVNDGTPTQRAKIEYKQLGDYEVVDGKTVATDPSGQGRPVLEWTVTFNEAEYDKMGGYYYFTIPNNVSDPYNVVTEYNNGAYSPRDGWKDGNNEPAGSISAEGMQYIDAGNKLEWRVKNTVGRDYNNVDGLSGVMGDSKKVYVLRFDNSTKAREVTIKYRTVIEDTSKVISYLAGVESKTNRPKQNWYAISGKYDKHLTSQVAAPSVTPNLTNTSVNVPVQTVASTSSTLSGTGVPGATIKLYIDGKEQNIGNVTVDGSGNWTTGELPTALNNNQGDGTTIKPRQTVEVSQVVNGEESSRRTVPVSVGVTTVEPSSLTTNQNAVVAGQKEVTLKVPHDAGIAYFRYTNTAGETVEIPVKRNNASSAWTSQKSDKATVKSVEHGKFQDTIVLTMADKIAGTEVSAISNVVEGGFSSVAGWQPRGVENQAPTIASAVEGNKKTVAQGAQLDLASLVTVADKEDDAQATLGDKVHAEVVSVNGNTATKTVDTNTPGTYTVRYKAVDSQLKESDEIEVTVVVENKTPETPKPEPQPQPQPETPTTSGPEIVNDLAGKASTPADVTVKAPAGSTVKLYKDDVVIGEAVANDQGVATITPTNSLPEGEITATSTPAGGKESAKSTPITVTKTPLTNEGGGVSRGSDNTQLRVNNSHITVYPGDPVNVGVTAASTAIEKFWVPGNPTAVEGVLPVGAFLTTAGGKTYTQRDAAYQGTVAETQKAGDTVVTFAVKSKKNVTVTRSLKVTVLESAKKYEPVAGTKVDVADPNNVSGDEKNKIIDSVKTANPSLPANATYSVDDKGNLTITYPDKSTDKVAAAYLVNPTNPARQNEAPTVEIPYSNKDTKEVYVYGGEANSFDIKFKDDSGKIASATVKQGGNKAFDSVAGEENTINTQYGFKANVINAETPATADAPAVITYSGTPAATDGLKPGDLEAATKGENPKGMVLGWRYATATDTDGALIENKATGGTTATDPGAFRVMLKAQTQKYDIATPSEKVTVADPANVTEAELAKIKEKVQLVYSKTNDDANLADKKGTAVADKDAKIKSIEKDADGNLVVTYADGSQDKKPLSEFVNVAPTVEIPYSNKDTKEVYVYGGEANSFDIKFKDDSGKIASATVKQGGNKAFDSVAGEENTINTQYGFKANVINAETPATADAPAVITYSGTPAATDGLKPGDLEAATKGENPKGMVLGWRYATATDTDGALIENKATGGTTATDPGAFRVMLKAQTQKYDIATPSEKVTVADPANVTEAELAKIKEKVQLVYSKTNDDANLADKKGTAVADKDAKIKSIEKDADGNLVVTYADGSQDKKPLSEFVNVAPTVEIPYSNKDTKEVYVYGGEANSFDIKFKDDSGKIASATVKQGGNKAFDSVAGEENTINTQYGFKANVINAETPATADAPAVITYSGTPAATDGLKPGDLEAATKGENPKGMVLGWRYATATDTDGALIENKATGGTTATDPGAFRVMLKAQTQKYDIATPSEKVTVADPANVTEAELAKIKEKVQLVYSKTNDDANLADKKGTAVADKDAKIKSIEKDADGNLVVTYADGSQDKKPLSEFVNVAPKVEVPYSNEANKQIYVYTGENTDLTFKGTDEKEVKDLYLRGPGDISWNNANQYGFTTGKVENGAVTGDGSVSEDKRTATIKMTGTTKLTAGKEWTSFIVSKDNDGKLSNADYRALDVDPNAKEKPGYVRFVVKNQTSKYDIATPADKVEVADPTNVTDAELDKIKEKLKLEYNKDNDDANIAKNTPVDKDGKIKSVTNDGKGNLVVTYTDGSKDTKPLSEFVTKKPTDADKNEPTPKAQTVDKGTEPKAEDSIGNLKDLPKGTTVAFKDPVDTTTPGEKPATAVVTYPDGSKDEVPVTVTVKDPSAPATDADKNTPVAKDQTVKPGEKPKAEDSIDNLKDLPKGTTVEFKTPVDTTTPGDKPATAVVTYPDGSKDEVPVKVTVKDPSAPATDADKNTPVAKDQTVKPGEKPKAEDSIDNLKDLPKGTTVEFKTPVDTTTPGDKPATAVVTYPDGSKDEVPVTVTVKDPSAPATDADKNTPVAKDQTVKPGEKPKAEDSIDNLKDLPKGTTVEFKTPVDTTTPGDKPATAVVTYPDGSKDEVPVTVTVKDPSAPATDADKNTPVAKDQTVKPGEKPKAEDSIDNLKDLPKGTTVEFKTPVDTTTPGDKPATAVVTYPDGSKDEVPVTVTVKDPSAPATDADKNTPVAKDQTVKPGEKPKAEDSIDNLKDLPKGTTVEFKTPVDTTTPGDKPATAVVTYPDGSKDEVPVTVTVKDPSAPATDADKNTPVAKDQTVKPGEKPKAEDSIDNLKDLPKGTTVEFKTPVDTTTPGDKPATAVVTYPDGSKDEVPVTVTVKDPSAPATDADKNTPVAKDQTVKPGEKPKAEDSIDNLKDLPKGTTVEFKTPVDTTTPGDKPATAVVTYPDGSKDEVPVKVTVKDPSAPATDADKNTPVAKDQTVKPGEKPKAEDSIDNLKDLPKGTTVEFKTPVDTTTPGDKPATAVVTYPDGSKDEVPVKVTVKDPSAPATDADKNTPVAKDQTVKPGEKPKAEDSIDNLKDLPKGTTVEFKTPVDTTTPGDKPATAVVTYPDGSKDEVPVTVTVKDPSAPATDADKNTPVAKDQTVKPGEKPKAEDSIDNLKDLPKGTTVEFKTPVDTTTPGDKPATAVVTYPDGSKDEVPVTVTVKDPSAPATDADKNTPVAKDQTVKPGEKPKAEDSIDNLKDLPKGTTVEFKTPVDTTTPGDKPATAVVTYPDGSKDEVPVKVTVKDPSAPATDADKNTPVAKDQTVKPGEKPKAEDSIDNLKDLPKGTTVEFKTPVDTTTPGDKPATAVVTYPDGSKDEVPVTVTVKDPSAPATDADKNTPVAKDQTVKPGEKPKAEDSIDNLKDLPKGTTVEFKTPVDTTTPGDKPATAVVTYPDGSKDEVPVTVTVKDPSAPATDADKNTPVAKDQTVKPGEKPKAEDSIDNLKDLPKGTTVEFKTPVDTTTPGDKPATAVVTYPDGSKDEVPVTVTVKDPSAPATDADKNTPVAKDQTVKPGEKPKAEDSIDNLKDLPKGTTVEFKTPVDTTTPGDKPATAVVTYPDGSKDEVPVTVTVKDPSAPATDADKNTPVAKDQTVKPGEKPKAEDSIDNLKDLPKGTTVEFKTPVDTTTPGDKPATAVVTYPDGSKDEVPVKVTVKDPSAPATDADKNTPVAKDQTVKPGEKPKAEDSIDNLKDLPKGTTVEFKTPVDTTTPGDKPATAVVTYPDGSKDEVPVKVTVKDPSAPATDADKNTPVAKDQTVKPGEKPKAEDSIDNLKDLPKGTTVEFKTPVDTTTPGDKPATAVVTYPDGSKDEVPVKVTVKDPSAPATDADKNTPVAKDQTVKPGEKPKAEDSIDNLKDLPKGTTVEFKTPVDTTTPGDKPATAVVTYPDGSKDEVPVKVTVKDPSAPATDADKNTPVAKDQTVKPGEKPKAEDSIDNLKDLPKGTTVEFKTPVDTTTPGDKPATAVVTYPDGSKDEVPVKVTVKDPSAPATDADKNTPVAKDQTVKPGEKPKAEDSIDNLKDLPKGTTVEFKTPVDTTTPGDKPATAVVTYPDGSKDEVPVTVTVKDPSAPATDADKNTPVAKDQTVKPGEKPKAEDSIDNLKDLPKGTTVEFKTPVDTTTPGDKPATAVVTYPDGSKDEVPVTVTVKDPSAPATDADKNTPVAKDQTVKPGDKPSAKDSIGNVGDLPEGTTVDFKTPVDTTTPGDKDATVVVTYPDGSKDEVPVTVTVKDPSAPATDADKNTPVAKDQTVKPGEKPKAEDSIDNLKDLPKGTTVEFKTPVDTTTPGDKPATAVVTYPDGSKDEVPVTVTVKDPSAPATDADKNTPVAKDQTVKPGEKPKAEDSIDNLKDLPKGTTVEFKTPVDTTTPGDKPATAVVTYPDGSKDEVPVTVTVKDPSAPATDADKNTPTAKDQTVKPGDKPSAKDSIGNVGDLPEGTTVDFKTPVDTTTPGDKDATVVVTYPDGSKDEVPVKVTVKDPTNKVVKDPSVTPVADPSNLTNAEKAKVADEVKKSNPTVTDVKVDKDGTTTVTYPDGTTAVIPADKTVKKSDDKAVKDPSVTPVADPSNLTDAEKAKVADEVKKSNPTVTDVKVDKDGTTTVTYPDGTTAVIPADKTVKKSDDKAVKDPSVTPVADPSNLTDAEKAKVADEVKKSNPTVTDVKVDKDGTTTVTYPDGTTAVIPADKTVKKSDDKVVTDPSVTPVTDPSNLTDAEKAKVADEVKKSNPTAKDVEVGKDGTTTVTYPDGTTAVIPADKTVKKSDDKAVKDPSVTPVTDPSNLTDAEKAKVADEVKKSNPTAKDVEVGKDGTTTVTYPDGTTAVIPADKTVKKSADKAVKDPSVTPVTDPSNLTNAEKAKVADEVKKSNPTAKDVEVGKDGTTTVTYPDGTTAVIPADKTVKKSADKAVKDPSVTPVTDPSNLTDAEKAKVADEVKKSNPTAKDVEVGKDGTTTVTYPDGTTAVIPADKTVKKSADKAVKDPSVTPVTDPSNLTDAEKAKVADEVKKSNPTAKDVEVGKDGTTTVTYPDGTTAVIPADKTVKKSADKAVKDPSVTPVTDPSNLTDAEKAKVADEVKKSNPTAKDVEVGKDGTTTVTYPDGTTAVIPADKTVKKSADKVVKDPSVTPVTDPSNLTDAEKGKVADEVKKSNPTAKDIKVNKDGSVIVTFEDGTTAFIPADKTVKKSSDKVKESDGVKNPSVTPVKPVTPAKTEVKDPKHLTDKEKEAVKDKVEKANPGKNVTVDDQGNATVTDPTNGSSATIPSSDLVEKAKDAEGVKDPESKTPVKDPSNLTDAEKAKVAEEVKKANPTAKDIKVNNDGSVVVTFEDGSVAVVPAEKAVTAANQDSPAQAPAKKAGAKELPNTGTEQSSASLALALLAAATGGLLFAKKREEEE